MSKLSELSADPVFQLNTLLWLAQPVPDGLALRPVLRESGFEVYAIAPQVALPPDILLQFKDSGVPHQDFIRPDVVLSRKKDRRYGLVECKGNSFGAESSNAKQARTLLAVAGPRLHEALGLAPGAVTRSAASYLVPAHSSGEIGVTLQRLTDELLAKRLPCAPSCVLGLAASATAMLLSADKVARDFFDLPEAAIDFITCEEGTDPRPLYFIPYDPDCNQSDKERLYCQRVLFERMHASILGAAGRCQPPTDLVFDAEELLNDATLGMYGLWENQDSAKHMRKLARRLLGRLGEVLRSNVAEDLRFVEGKGWTLGIASEATKDAVCAALSKFSCETMDLRQEPLPGLFDEQD